MKVVNVLVIGVNVVYGNDDGLVLMVWLNYLMIIWLVKGDLFVGVYYFSFVFFLIMKLIVVFGYLVCILII